MDVYVHAHQDDWQLFVGDHVTSALGTAEKVVLVYTTAGDAGDGAPYWQARERASKASVDSIAGTGAWTCATPTVRTHVVTRCTKGKTVSYYLRMPDGNYWDGTGYGFGGLAALRDRGTATSPRDGSTTYTSWADFTGTIAAIVDAESAGRAESSVSVHAPDHDRSLNPDDHPDHWATADAVRAASAGRGWSLTWYVDYATEYRPANLTAAAHETKRKQFAAYDRVMATAGYETLIDRPNYQAWLWRTYFRTVTVAPPPPPPPPPATVKPTGLTAVGSRNGANRRTDLKWGGNAPTVDVWRNGTVLRAGVSGTAYTDTPEKKASGTFTYQVCTAGKSGADNCSNTAAVTF